jgi:hypothetical protein
MTVVVFYKYIYIIYFYSHGMRLPRSPTLQTDATRTTKAGCILSPLRAVDAGLESFQYQPQSSEKTQRMLKKLCALGVLYGFIITLIIYFYSRRLRLPRTPNPQPADIFTHSSCVKLLLLLALRTNTTRTNPAGPGTYQQPGAKFPHSLTSEPRLLETTRLAAGQMHRGAAGECS